MPEKDDKGRVYNTCYVFDREGRQIGKHRKAHLFDIAVKGGQCFKESDTLTAGNRVSVLIQSLAVLDWRSAMTSVFRNLQD